MGTKTDKKTLTREIKEYYSERINQGSKVDSQVSTQELTNQALDHFKRGSNHKGWFNKLLKNVLIEKNISLGEAGFTGKGAGGLKYKIEKTIQQVTAPPAQVAQPKEQSKDALGKPAAPQPQAAPQMPPQMPPQYGPLPAGQIPTQVKKIWTEQEKKEMGRMFEKGLSFLGTLYKKTGLVKSKTVVVHEAMEEEEFDKEVKEIAMSWADYCVAHDISLPSWIELFMLSSWTFFVFGAPLITVLISGMPKEKPKQDQKLADVKSEKELGGDKKEL